MPAGKRASSATDGKLRSVHGVWIPAISTSTVSSARTDPEHLGEVFRRLASQKESRILEGHLMPDHVHMLISIPPKYAVSQVIGYIKGRSAIHLARVYGEKKRNFVGQHFCAGLFCIHSGS